MSWTGGSREKAPGSVYDRMYFTDEELKRGAEILDQADKGQISWDSAHNWWESTRANYGYTGGEDGHGYTKLGGQKKDAAPDYVNRYQGAIDNTMAKVLKPKAFEYDHTADPNYQQYADAYTRMGQKAMEDTLGRVSARTGGLASSYATAASQQAYDSYMAELANKVPELRQLAYQMYSDDLARDVQGLNTLLSLEGQDYGRHRDAVGDWNAERTYQYGVERDNLADQQYADQVAYQTERDKIADQQYAEKVKYQQGRDALADQRDDKQDARDRVWTSVAEMGVDPSQIDPDLVEASGYSEAELAGMAGFYKDNKAPKVVYSGGGGGNPKPSMTFDDVKAWADKYGDEYVEEYITMHHEALGFDNKTEALAAWRVFERESGIEFNPTIIETPAMEYDGRNYGEGKGIGIFSGSPAAPQFTWNGQTYSSVEEMVEAFAATNPTDAEVEAFNRDYLAPLGYSIS